MPTAECVCEAGSHDPATGAGREGTGGWGGGAECVANCVLESLWRRGGGGVKGGRRDVTSSEATDRECHACHACR